ncbi:MAG: phosphoribosylformylglycinamidine synthase subunit PurQ [Flavobacteriales bacterium]
MKCGVVTFPGSNCDEDMRYALADLLGADVVSLWHKDQDLQGAEMLVLPGGFSYGDHLRAGAIARFSPIMEEVIAHAKKGGPVLGICNGFQILCEAGLLPGTLMVNQNRLFVCRNTYIRVDSKETYLTSELEEGDVLQVPVAHKEGRYFASEATLDALEKEDRVLFRYSDQTGKTEESVDPNGSFRKIAGICNPERNVIGMMPHPERATDPLLGNSDGASLLRPLVKEGIKA